MNKENINILFSCNSAYVMPMSVSIASLFENNKNYNINIYILHSDITKEQEDILYKFAKKYNQNIFIKKVDDKYFETAKTLRWTKETYYRLLINELLPDNLDRLLYLDCDIVVNNSIEELYFMDLKDKYIAALIESENKEFRSRLGLNPEGYYFQAGVILFDIKKSKKVLSYENSIKILSEIGENLIAVDQDVINKMFDQKIMPLDEKFNNCKITNFYNNNLYRLFNYINKKDLLNNVIFHYSTGKPWNNLFSGSAENIWYKYLKLSPFEYLYNKKYNTFKYKFLRLGAVKIIFFTYIHITPLIESFMQKILSKDNYIKMKGLYRKYIK